MFDKHTSADPVGITSTPYFTTYPDMTEIFDEDKIKLEIGQHIYDLRASTARTQTEFAEFVGVEESIVADLEEGDYEGDSLAVLAHIEKAVRRHISAIPFPLTGVYPNALLATTITGFKLRFFRHHPGRKTTASCTESKVKIDGQHMLNELSPWQYVFGINRQELAMFALAGMTEWGHLDGGVRVNFSGNPNEYIHAVDTHTLLIDAVIHYIHTGEQAALKQWRQDMGTQQHARYLAELEAALHAKTFEELPDTEWITRTLIQFVRMNTA